MNLRLPHSRSALVAWLVELVKFGAVGAVAYVVDAGGYNLLVFGPGHLFADQPVRGGILSGLASIIVAWLGNRLWTFRQKRSTNRGKEFLAFLAVNLIGVGIAQGCLYLSRWVFDNHTALADNIARNLIGVGLGTIFRYFCYKFVIFTGQSQTTKQ
ncbi:MAG: GtrA family protein [Bifidobacteriaceae bacterium]|nr:GtrA family protein [Bifidobacteriaceae bacterium]